MGGIKKLIPFFIIIVVNIIIAIVCVLGAHPKTNLLPDKEERGQFKWKLDSFTDKYVGGASTVFLADKSNIIDFTFRLSHQSELAGAGVLLLFQDKGANGAPPKTEADLSGYSKITFWVNCNPATTLRFELDAFDKKVTVASDSLSFRPSITYFNCENEWQQVVIDFKRLEVPLWWLDMHKFSAGENGFDLRRVNRIIIGSSHQSPYDKDLNVKVRDFYAEGDRPEYLYIYGVFLIASLMGGYAWWLRLRLKKRDEALTVKPQFVGYKQLDLEPSRDREKSAVMLQIAKCFADSEIDIEGVAKATGVSRSKINEILKAEVGCTFTVYLNKLRLSEAARLLAEKAEANITEIVYVVGYKNISYFNKLFKEEFGCTPKEYKQKCASEKNNQKSA